ncbi:hypothetical protein LJC58_08170 [Lachnospiraceae bacterium OttesenSCG-928-D06]|nr:hypothetical protein [Lachnospiraceae bacterium OttesenSCG-928-D06]
MKRAESYNGETIRRKVNIPNTLYEKVKILSGRINIPVSTLINLMVVEATKKAESGQATFDYCKSKYNCEKTAVNVTFSAEIYYNHIDDKIDKHFDGGARSYTITDYIIDCIEYELQGKFEAFITLKSKELPKYLRIKNTSSEKYKDSLILDESNQFNLLDEYIAMYTSSVGVRESLLKKYWLAQFLSENLDDFDKFLNPHDYE